MEDWDASNSASARKILRESLLLHQLVLVSVSLLVRSFVSRCRNRSLGAPQYDSEPGIVVAATCVIELEEDEIERLTLYQRKIMRGLIFKSDRWAHNL